MEYWIPVGALDAFGVSLQSTANNIANATTEEYRPGDVVLETGPDGQGVVVAESTPGSSEPYWSRQEEKALEDSTTSRIERSRPGQEVDLAKEMIALAQDQRAFEANIRTLRTLERMSGHVLDSLA